jgi:D-glycero-alpha-D-manno-heptose-7-phosphate kinase
VIISRTPVRISFFGGGTDYRDYYEENGGAVIGTTINQYVYVTINRLSNFFNYKIRVGYSNSELVNSINDIVHPSVRECLKYKAVEGNLDIHIVADLPARTGLGSSSAFTAGFLHALYTLEGKVVSKEQLANDSLYVEQDLIKENVGSQDQIHASYGGFNLIEFSSGKFKVQPVIISKEKCQTLEDSLMIFFTGQTRFATEILSEQVERTRAKDNDIFLKEMNSMVYDAIDIISNENKNIFVKSLGNLMNEGWRLKKLLSTSVSNQQIDDAYEKAIKAGALGGKISGAGGGGFLMLLVDPSRKDNVREALSNLLEVQFKFEDTGSSIIYYKN